METTTERKEKETSKTSSGQEVEKSPFENDPGGCDPMDNAKAAPEVPKVYVNAQAVTQMYNNLMYAMNHGAYNSFSFDDMSALSAAAITVREEVRRQIPSSVLVNRQDIG